MIWWTERWNPIGGCTKCSPACANCYAEKDHTKRHKAYLAGKLQNTPCYSTPFDRVRFFPERLEKPLHWRKPKRIFVCNMGDLFHEDVMDTGVLDQIFAVMARCPQHTFMLCTKRPDNQHKYITSEADLEHMAWLADMSLGEAQLKEHAPAWPLPNVWLGTTIWDQPSADRAVPILLSTPAAKRFVSVEPMLGPVDLGKWIGDYDCHACGNRFWADMGTCASATWTPREDDADNDNPGCPYCGHVNSGDATVGQVVADDYAGRTLDGIKCGGETGPGARPMHPDWPRSLRDQCVAAGVPFMFKQWGEWASFYDRDIDDPDWRECPRCDVRTERYVNLAGGHGFHGKRVCAMRRVGTRCAGRVLDGRTWEEVPHA